MKKFTLIFGFFSLFALAGCEKETPKIESPEVVLKKMWTESPKAYRLEGEVKFDINAPENGINMQANSKVKTRVDSSDLENFQFESEDQGVMNYSFDDFGEKASMDTKIANHMKWIGDDLYFGYTEYDFNMDLPDMESFDINTILQTFIKPYLNDTFHVSVNNAKDLIEPALKYLEYETGIEINATALKNYGMAELMVDLQQAGLFKVVKDFGMEEIETISSQKVTTYHYQIYLDSKGLKKLVESLNDRFKIVDPQILDGFFEEEITEKLKWDDIIALLNELVTYEIWVGQTDYHVYQMKMEVNKENLKAVLEKAESLNEAFSLSESDLEDFDAADINLSVVMQSEPIDSFTLEKPDKIIDLDPFIDVVAAQLEKELPTEADAYYKVINRLNNEAQDTFYAYDDLMYDYMDLEAFYLDGTSTVSPEAEVKAFELDRQETLESLKVIRDDLFAAGGLSGDTSMRDLYIEGIDDMIFDLEKQYKEINDVWLKMIAKEIPQLEGEEKVNQLLEEAYSSTTLTYDEIEMVRQNFFEKHNIDPSRAL